MHGAVEKSRTFYTHSNKGLAPFLAEAGFNCYRETIANVKFLIRAIQVNEILVSKKYT